MHASRKAASRSQSTTAQLTFPSPARTATRASSSHKHQLPHTCLYTQGSRKCDDRPTLGALSYNPYTILTWPAAEPCSGSAIAARAGPNTLKMPGPPRDMRCIGVQRTRPRPTPPPDPTLCQNPSSNAPLLPVPQSGRWSWIRQIVSTPNVLVIHDGGEPASPRNVARRARPPSRDAELMSCAGRDPVSAAVARHSARAHGTLPRHPPPTHARLCWHSCCCRLQLASRLPSCWSDNQTQQGATAVRP